MPGASPGSSCCSLGQIALNYGAALAIGATRGRAGAARDRASASRLNLALLGLFKYADFVVGTLNAVLPAGASLSLPGLALPLGISFFTFHAISYLIDVHRARGRRQPQPARRSRSISPCSRNSWPARSSAITPSRASLRRAA